MSRPAKIDSTTPFAFATSRLDRAAEKRDDANFIAGALADPNTGLVVFSDGECLIEGADNWRIRYQSPAQLNELRIALEHPVFLGLDDGQALFAIEIGSEQCDKIKHAQFVQLWRNAARFSDQEAATVAYAKGMLEWHTRHRYCGLTGAENTVALAGHQLVGGAKNTQFPRVDPAIIVLVHRDDVCLLGRQAVWPENRYSTIAGFVEPGESLEAAVVREVKEETNVDVTEVEYRASQPWPFPSSLMVGFHARAAAGPIVLNDKELADARWFHREDIATHKVLVPPKMSIAFHLIEQWFDRPGQRTLSEVAAGQHWG